MTASSTWRPEREVMIVAGTPPGGGLDRAARALLTAIESTRLLEVPARVNNVPGDGARKCWTYMAQRERDPHIVAIGSANLTTDFLLGAARYDHDRDFTPLAILYTEYIAFAVRSDSTLKSGADLVARFAARPGSVAVALSTSLGNPNHIALARIVRHAGGDVKAPKIRVFDSALDAVADVAAGNADVCAVTAASAVKEIAAGTMRALAVSAPQRLEGLYAQTPTWLEQSANCVIGAWRGVTGARGITPDQVAFWEGLLAQAVETPAWKEDLARLYWTPSYLDGAALREHLGHERREIAAVLRDLGML